MPDEQEYLLYPIDTGKDPICLRCANKMLLANSEVREGRPTFLIFRCVRCGQSEKFVSEDWWTRLESTAGPPMPAAFIFATAIATGLISTKRV